MRHRGKHNSDKRTREDTGKTQNEKKTKVRKSDT